MKDLLILKTVTHRSSFSTLLLWQFFLPFAGRCAVTELVSRALSIGVSPAGGLRRHFHHHGSTSLTGTSPVYNKGLI